VKLVSASTEWFFGGVEFVEAGAYLCSVQSNIWMVLFT